MNNDTKFLNIERRTRYSITNFEDKFELRASVIFRPKYVWFASHLYIGMIPNFSGQFAELIVYIIPQE